jgi:hypothetical protein
MFCEKFEDSSKYILILINMGQQCGLGQGGQKVEYNIALPMC